MNNFEAGKVSQFAVAIVNHIMNHYGENVSVTVNNNKSGSIGHHSITLAGKSISNAFENGARFRDTIHRTVAQLSGRYPNGYEGVYWLALNSAASFIMVQAGEYGRTRIKARAVAYEVRRLSNQFTFDDMLAKFHDVETAVPVPFIVPAGMDPDPRQGPDGRWPAQRVNAWQTYVKAIVDHLMWEFGFTEKIGTERTTDQPAMKTIFRKKNGAHHMKRVDGVHELVFGYQGMQRRFDGAFTEYAIVHRNFPEFDKNNMPRGMRALYWITCHEFAHALQTEIENGVEIKRSKNGSRRRSVHNMTFIREYRRVVDAFTFEDSLKLINSATVGLLGG